MRKKTKRDSEENLTAKCYQMMIKSRKEFLESDESFADNNKETAASFSYTEEATDMVTDRSSYVWQLIDEMAVMPVI